MGIAHKIELKLSSAGYRGEEINSILPDFITYRKTLVGLTWYPSAEGPERYVLVVTLGAILANVTKVFMEELCKDIYKWVKDKLLILFYKKRAPFGLVRIKMDNVYIDYYVENTDKLLKIWDLFPEIISRVDPALSDEWIIDEEINGEFKIRPIKKKS
jgi:hypothetical protein